jgi:GR25 family glycosyltransferase involved in LPS biosynthesis
MTLDAAMAPAFTLYVIHTQGLAARAPGMKAAVQTIGTAAEAAGFAFNSVFITDPDPPAIAERIKEYEKDGATPIDYAPTGVAALDHPSNLHVLSLQELSNLEKHREAWRRIGAAHDVAAVIEDDVILLPDFATGFADALKKEQVWDIFFWGLGPQADILPSKEAYFVTPAFSQRLLAGSTPIKFGTRLYLSWSLIGLSGPPANVGSAPTRWTADGTKLGVFPSACRANNPLIFNKEYMDVMVLLPQIGAPGSEAYVAEALRDRLPALLRVRAPDALYLAGVVQEKLGNYEDARDLYVEAIQEMGRQGGILTTTSDLMTSTMKVHRHLQGPALAEARAAPSKYDNAPLL